MRKTIFSFRIGDNLYGFFKWTYTERDKKLQREMMRRYFDRKRKKGICITGGCWKKVERGYAKCKVCRLEDNRKRRKFR